jgi:type VI secretion system secreted protein VgrG
MAQFLAAIQYVLLNEGGFSDDPNDPGGATNFGILQRELPGVDIRTITREQAISFYLPNYWNKALYANIASQQVATKLFDMHVNLGLVPAVRIAQHALGFQDANVDGDMGPMTVAAINAADPASFLAGVVGLLTTHYKLLEARNPKLMAFDRGWMARANKLPPADPSSGAGSTIA